MHPPTVVQCEGIGLDRELANVGLTRAPKVDLARSDALMNVSRHHDVVPDLLWDDVKDWFDLEWNGSLPDVAVRHTTQSDWQAVVDLVRSKGWAYEYPEDGRVLRVPSRVEAMFDRAAEANVILKVWPAPGLLAAFRPHEAEEILFDVDLREIQSQEQSIAAAALNSDRRGGRTSTSRLDQ